MSKPFVSVLTPTYNRRKFIPWLIECFKAQEYPQDKMEWIILDDGVDKVEDVFLASGLKNVRYYYEPEKLKIGAKRNKLNALATGDIIVCFDDDDFYPPERVSHVVSKLNSFRNVEICGSSQLYLHYSDIKQIYSVGPYGKQHCTNGTMAYRKSYIKDHKYDETVVNAEERSFLDNYSVPMVQLDPMKVMLVISHSQNTYDKIQLRNNNPMFKLTKLKMNVFIKSKAMRDFYANA